MLDKIKTLGADTAVYGVSAIVGRFLNFLLVPFYTNVLATSQYGVVATVYSYIAFMNILYLYGMESAYFKYASTKEIGNEKEIFSTPFISVLITSLLLSGFIFLESVRLAPLVEVPLQFADTIKYSALIMFFDSIGVIPFAVLRLERKVKTFAAIKVINIVINVAANVILLLVFHMGVEGIFISGVIASAASVILLLPTIFKKLGFHFRKDLYKSLLKFGLPYVPAGLAAMMVQVIDRPILLALTNESTVGIYQANYRLGIFMMLVVSMFDYAWRPFFLTHASDKNAKEMYSKILTYFVLFGSIIVLLVSLYVDDIVKIRVFHRFIINPAYWSGLGIVPVVLIGYLFNGMYVNFMAGIYIEKKTSHLPYITGIGAAVNVVANLLMIPKYGMLGAAWATLFAYAAMALVLYFVSHRFYPVHYEYARLLKIWIALVVVVLAHAFRHVLFPGLGEQLFKFAALLSFFIMLFLSRFATREELNFVRRRVTP